MTADAPVNPESKLSDTGSRSFADAPSEARAASGDDAVGARVAATAEALQGSFVNLLDALPGAPLRAQEVARTLGIKKDVSNRLVRATMAPDPMASIQQMPGPEALRRLVAAAQKQLAQPALLQRASEAIDQYERLVRDTAGDRGRFDTLLSGWLPEVRERVDLLCRQSVYRGISGIKGVAIDFKIASSLLTPSEDGAHVDVTWLIGALGVRRLREGAVVRFSTRTMNTPASFYAANEGGSHSDAPFGGLDLASYLPSPRGEVSSDTVGELTSYVLRTGGLGADAATNVLFAQVHRHALNRFEVSPDAPRLRGTVAEADLPIRAIVFDTLVHKDIFPGEEPKLIMHDTTSRGIASVNDPSRVIDRIEHNERVNTLGSGLRSARLAEYPRYTELLGAAIERIGFNAADFRVYRCRIEYPLYGSQVHLCFTAPPAPRQNPGQPAGDGGSAPTETNAHDQP